MGIRALWCNIAFFPSFSTKILDNLKMDIYLIPKMSILNCTLLLEHKFWYFL